MPRAELPGLRSLVVALLALCVLGGCPTGTVTGGNQTGDDPNSAGETGNDDGNGATETTPQVIFDNGNIAAVFNRPTQPTVVTLDQAYRLTLVQDYHWNDAEGATPGTIALHAEDGTVYGPWQTTGLLGQGGVPNAYWTCYPNAVVPAGTYTVVDSDPATWSQNSESDQRGMCRIEGVPVGQGGPGQTAETGTVTGTVVDAQTGASLSGVTVKVNGTELSTTTGADGKFSLAGVPVGNQTLSLTLSGYVTGTTTATVASGAAADVSMGLVKQPVAGQEVVAAVLTWGTNEATQAKDLDLHISGPDGSGGRFHVYYRVMAPVTHAFLDLDDLAFGGPETITIRRAADGNFVAGEYHIWVQNYTASPEFNGSDAVVTLSAAGSQIGQWTVSSATGDPILDVWQVVKIEIDASGAVTSMGQQQIFADGFSTTEF